MQYIKNHYNCTSRRPEVFAGSRRKDLSNQQRGGGFRRPIRRDQGYQHFRNKILYEKMDLSDLFKNVIIVGDLYWFQCKRAENFFYQNGSRL